VNTRSNAILAGVAALAVAVAILAVSMLSGVPVVSTLVNTSQGNSGQGSTTQVASPGTLSIMLTDPPHVPEGVTAVYVYYSDLAVHVSGVGNGSGWTKLTNGGSIDLISTVNISQTIAATRVPTGRYNALSLNVTSATVTSNGRNYTAFVVGGYLFVPIAGGGVEVNDSKPSATIIQISPLVMNIGSDSNLEFVIRSTAIAWPIPSGQVTAQMQHEGFRFPLAGGWWRRFSQNATANLQITGASLSSGSLSVTVMGGIQSTRIGLVIVSPLAEALGGSHWGRMPMGLAGTSVFVVQPNGTLTSIGLMRGNMPAGGDTSLHSIRAGLLGGGYNLTAGSKAAFSYSGPINLGFFRMQSSIVPQQQYVITVIGTDALASQVVVAT
jgi:hypothetical protein